MHMNDLDFYRAAKILLDQHGMQGAWSVLTVKAINHHLVNDHAGLAITQAVQAALRTLTFVERDGGELVH